MAANMMKLGAPLQLFTKLFWNKQRLNVNFFETLIAEVRIGNVSIDSVFCHI